MPTITIRTHPNQKSWINGDMHAVLRARPATFNVSRTNPMTLWRAGAYKASRHELRKAIGDLKGQYRLKVAWMLRLESHVARTIDYHRQQR